MRACPIKFGYPPNFNGACAQAGTIRIKPYAQGRFYEQYRKLVGELVLVAKFLVRTSGQLGAN